MNQSELCLPTLVRGPANNQLAVTAEVEIRQQWWRKLRRYSLSLAEARYECISIMGEADSVGAISRLELSRCH